MENIYIIGMRGVGKTTIGRMLANTMGRDFLDLDQDIAHAEGGSISEMVNKHGWDYFRQKEEEAVNRVTQKNNLVVSTGGGVLMFYENAEKLKASGKCVLLTASSATLFERLSAQMEERPKLTKHKLNDEIQLLWEQRKDVYHNYANLVIETDGKTPQQILERIQQSLN